MKVRTLALLAVAATLVVSAAQGLRPTPDAGVQEVAIGEIPQDMRAGEPPLCDDWKYRGFPIRLCVYRGVGENDDDWESRFYAAKAELQEMWPEDEL